MVASKRKQARRTPWRRSMVQLAIRIDLVIMAGPYQDGGKESIDED
jgi:hypothetical protein